MFDHHAVFHTEIRSRALKRLQLLRHKPEVILDLGAGTGHASRALKKNFPHAQVIAIDSAVQMLQQSRRQQTWWRRFMPVAGDAVSLPLKTASVDWVFSNLMLPWTLGIDTVFAEVRRVLKPGGAFCFTSLGPDTLQELRLSWAADQPHTHVHGFIDMHDIGDALVRAHFAEPVLDVERFTLTYPNVNRLLEELRATGSSNRTRARRRSLGGRSQLHAMVAKYEQRRIDGKIPATLEVVYGQAWKTATDKLANPKGETWIPLRRFHKQR